MRTSCHLPIGCGAHCADLLYDALSLQFLQNALNRVLTHNGIVAHNLTLRRLADQPAEVTAQNVLVATP